MTLPRSAADVLAGHVTLELECIDRMYLNVYQPRLQHVEGVVESLRSHRGYPIASSALLEPISRGFIAELYRFAAEHHVPVVDFVKGQRKDDVAHEFLAEFDLTEGVLFVGRAQEKASVFRTEKRHSPVTGASYPWIVKTTAMVNHFYVYAVDADFGPFFIKFCSYFPYNAKLCVNANEWGKRQAAKTGIGFEALDNGFAACEDPGRLQRICDRLDPARIDRLLRKWLKILPHPFSGADRRAGYRYDISILQAEFSLTQMLDRPVSGRVFFETVIRENLDVGRPDYISLIFDRRIFHGRKVRTEYRFRTRVFTAGVTPSLHVEYKHTKIKQYHKEGRALRTETTINDTRDFWIGKRLCNLPALREVGFSANRRLLHAQTISHDPIIGDTVFNRITQPALIDGQRVPGLRFGDRRVHALLDAIVIDRLGPNGFSNRDLKALVADLLAVNPTDLSSGMMTYDLRRLRLHGLIERIPHTHRYRPTPLGWRAARFYTHAYNRLLRNGTADIADPASTSPLRRALDELAARSGLAA
ncbi:MAG: hypothetical protein IVW52_20210 [Acidimicrobiales bacterium]|nr:hypothetical protein [Acidimicrobiales bacterium]